MFHRHLRAVIFDVDGTLVTDDLHWRKHNHMLQNILRPPQPALLPHEWRRISGFSDQDAYNHLVDMARNSGAAASFPLAALYIEQANDFFRANMGQIQLRAGAGDIIAAARRQGLVMGIATNADEQETRAKLMATGIIESFQFFSVLDGIRCPKPAPDLYIHGIRQASAIIGADIPASQVLAIEDTVTGAQSALAAGCHTLLWKHEGDADVQFELDQKRLHVVHRADEIVDMIGTRSLPRPQAGKTCDLG